VVSILYGYQYGGGADANKYGEVKIVGTFLAQFWHTQPQITGESRSRGE
tara:strand:+ start:2931 stop:3077 length:147 start_codon:yes stop_codon:yes gene_type:complete